MLPNYLYALEKDDQILDGDLGKIKALKSDLKNQWTLPTDLLKYKFMFARYANFKYLSVDSLKRISHFMSLEPVTGFNIINNILGIFSKVGIKIQIPIDAPGLNVISRMILARELNLYFSRLRKEDEMLNIHRLHEFNED
jgi:hypothetical protein